MLRTLSFGSLDKTTFTVADTIPSQGAIHWSYYKGLLVQSKPVSCPEWPGKKNPLLLTGLPVEVDGFSFNCRIPILPDDLDICQAVDWGEWRFWAVKWTNQKAPYIVDLNRRWKGAPSKEENPNAWLRLIMEPLPLTPEQFVGRPVKLMFQAYILRGYLNEITSYDLVCQMTEDTHISPDWGTKKEGKIYIDREAVINIAPNEEDL